MLQQIRGGAIMKTNIDINDKKWGMMKYIPGVKMAHEARAICPWGNIFIKHKEGFMVFMKGTDLDYFREKLHEFYK